MARNEETAETVGVFDGPGNGDRNSNSNSNSNEWDNISDYEERRKIQNRVAQRNYRARKKSRHQGKQDDLGQNFNLQDDLEPFGLQSLVPNLLDSNSSSVDQTGLQGYNTMFREPWVPNDLTKQPTPVDMAWSSMPDPSSMPSAQHYTYAYPNPFQPVVSSNISQTTNSSNAGPLPSGSGRQTLHSSASSQQHADSDPAPPEVQRSRRDLRGTSKDSTKHAARPKPRRKEIGQSDRFRQDLPAPKKVPKHLDADPTTRKAKALTPLQSPTQQRMLQCAYKQGRKEVLASSSKEPPTLHNQIRKIMDRLVQIYEFGVNLDVIKSDARFEGHIQAAKQRLASQSRPRAKKLEQESDSEIQSPSGGSETDSAEETEDDDDDGSDDVEEELAVYPVFSRSGKSRRLRV